MIDVLCLRTSKSENSYLYVEYTADLKERFKLHSAGKVRSTKAYIPWKLVYYEAYLSKNDVAKRENQLKNHKAKEDLEIQIKRSLL